MKIDNLESKGLFDATSLDANIERVINKMDALKMFEYIDRVLHN